jgi:hypothetical protein
MASGFEFRGGDLAVNLGTFESRISMGVSATVDFVGAGAEGQMKTQAPWTDRTGAARTGLHTSTENGLRAWTLVLAHAVNYGIWLETIQSGRYAIILKVLVDAGNRIMALLEGLFGRI